MILEMHCTNKISKTGGQSSLAVYGIGITSVTNPTFIYTVLPLAK